MKYENPKLTVDGVIFKSNKILLIKRKNPPFKDIWALPGGFVEYNEKTEDAVVREIFEETGLKTKVKSLLGVYSDPSRDPRGHTVSVVYVLVSGDEKVVAGDDASLAKFFNVDDLPELAFDHKVIINDAVNKEC